MFHLSSLVGILCILPSLLALNSRSTIIHITVKEGGSFVHYLDTDNGELQSCMLQTKKGEQISLYPDRLHEAVNPVKEKIVNFGKRACGFKLNNFNEEDPIKYNLTASILKAGEISSINETLEVTLSLESVEIANKTALLKYGEQFIVTQCTKPTRSSGFCSLYSPQGKLVAQGTNCFYQVTYAFVEHIGAWRCELNLVGNLEPITFYINTSPKKMSKLESWYKKENGYGIIGCQYIDGDDKEEKIITDCAMITPEKKLLNIEQHPASGRYDPLGTNFTKKICQVEFKLPALQNEIGTWRCELGGKRGFVNVERASEYPKTIKVFRKPGGTTSLSCEVPYPAVTSFAVNPEGKVVYKASYEESQNGYLYFQIYNMSANDFGEWTCHFAKNASYEDDVITLNVERYNMVKAKVKQVEVNEGESLTLLFTANGAISYCVIEDPKGNTYHVRPSTNSPYMEYFGAGFEHGECGVRLKHASGLHKGLWKCMTTTTSDSAGDQQATAMTQVDVTSQDADGLTAASSSSILIGIMFAVMVATAFIIYAQFVKEKKARKERVSPCNSLGDENSGTSFVLHHL